MTNTHRINEIKQKSLERYESELNSLNSLNKFVKSRGRKIENKEQELMQSIVENKTSIKSVRNHPQEKQKMLGYLDRHQKQLKSKFSP